VRGEGRLQQDLVMTIAVDNGVQHLADMLIKLAHPFSFHQPKRGAGVGRADRGQPCSHRRVLQLPRRQRRG
jgi:hypothetical protein